MSPRPERLSDIVHGVLRDHLVAGRFPPQTRFTESDLARQFGVSRVPARTALERLAREGLLRFSTRRGFSQPTPPDMSETDATQYPVVDISPAVQDRLESRNSRQRIFESAQVAIASAMVFGPFGINEKALAADFGVSRSVAREVLSRMERVGLVLQRATGRWQTSPMAATDVHDHYFMRRTLEPLALRSVAPTLSADRLRAQVARLDDFRAHAGAVGTRELLLIERWLHRDIVLGCRNRVLAGSIERSQLPLISTHVSFVATRSAQSVLQTIDQHLAVLQALIAGDVEAAAAALSNHLEAADAVAALRIQMLSQKDLVDCPPYMFSLEPGR